jgi:hypothetical protein
MTEFIISSNNSFLPIDIIKYILIFDKRFILRKGKILIINPIDLPKYTFLLEKPLITPAMYENIIFAHVVQFVNPKYNLRFSRVLHNDNITFRLVFETIMSDKTTLWNVFYLE